MGPESTRSTCSRPMKGASRWRTSSKGRSQLLVYHFMFGPDYKGRVSVLLGDCGRVQRHFRPPGEPRRHALRRCRGRRSRSSQAYKRRMGWTFPWASSARRRLQLRLQRRLHPAAAARWKHRIQLPRRGGHAMDAERRGAGSRSPSSPPCAEPTRATYARDRPGMSAFVLEDGVVSTPIPPTRAGGWMAVWGMYQWLDRAPRGRNETGRLVAAPR